MLVRRSIQTSRFAPALRSSGTFPALRLRPVLPRVVLEWLILQWATIWNQTDWWIALDLGNRIVHRTGIRQRPNKPQDPARPARDL